MLLTEERYVVKWLSQYGALHEEQLIRLLNHKDPKTAKKIIRNLVRCRVVSEVRQMGYYGLDEFAEPDNRTVTAVWVLIQFIDKVNALEHYPAHYPAQLYFLKEQMGYEICVLYEGEGHHIRLVQAQEEMKYIFVVPDKAFAKRLKLPKVPVLFASVGEWREKQPDIEFFSSIVKEGQNERG